MQQRLVSCAPSREATIVAEHLSVKRVETSFNFVHISLFACGQGALIAIELSYAFHKVFFQSLLCARQHVLIHREVTVKVSFSFRVADQLTSFVAMLARDAFIRALLVVFAHHLLLIFLYHILKWIQLCWLLVHQLI